MASRQPGASPEIYREHPAPSDLRGVVACMWEQRPAAPRRQLIVPDGCIDLIWLAERELVVAGADTGPRTVLLPAGLRSSGLRLKPGAGGAFLARPALELCDRQASAEELFGAVASRLAEQLATAPAPERLRLLANAARGRRVVADPLVMAAARRLAGPGARVAAVARELAISERQLHRRTTTAVGYSPKILARVLRLQRLTRSTGASLVERALAAGYASQAHMCVEVRALTGLSASRYLVRFVEDAARGPA